MTHLARYIKELSAQLMGRLPELEWKLSTLDAYWFCKSLPNNIFRGEELSSAHCIAQLRSDIYSLTQQTSYSSAEYISEQIMHKINVLVGLSRAYHEKKRHMKPSFGIKELTTRQQWISTLEHELSTLQMQHQALSNALAQMVLHQQEADVVLKLKAELGTLEKRLTLTQEKLGKVVVGIV